MLCTLIYNNFVLCFIYTSTVTVDITINVLSARDRTFTVSCTSTGGTVLDSIMTGLGISGGTKLQPVGTLERRGSDVYSATSRVVTAGVESQATNGVVYVCSALNGVATPPEQRDTVTLRGIIHCIVTC